MTCTRILSFVALVSLACGPKQGTTPPPGEPEGDAPGLPADDSSEPEPAGDGMTAAECEAAGGTVVGDIGDGAIHQPDYVCPDSGEPPLASIEPEPGGPIGVEGSVCCGTAPAE